MSSSVLLSIAVPLIVIAGLSAILDAALSRISPSRVEEMAREGEKRARPLLRITQDLAHHVSLLLLLRLGCELSATVLVSAVAFRHWGFSLPVGAIAAAAMIVTSFVLLGVLPRAAGRAYAYPIALLFARPLRGLGHVLGPLARVLTVVGRVITPRAGHREGPFVTEGELRDLVDLAEQRGDVRTAERQMLHSVFELSDTIAREVMVPRPDVVWVDQDTSAAEALTLALHSGFSRVPVAGENTDDVVGVVYLKDLARALHLEAVDSTLTVSDLMRPAEFVPESKRVDALLREMQARRIHVAIVVDEYGGTAGLVTIEDIVEEIVGEITDEYDDEQPPIEKLGEGLWRVTARLSVDTLSELVDVQLPHEDVETVGGLLAQNLGHVPRSGSVVTLDGVQLTAESVSEKRNHIDTVCVKILERAESATP